MMTLPRPEPIDKVTATNADVRQWLGSVIAYAASRGIDIDIFPAPVSFLEGTAKTNWVNTDTSTDHRLSSIMKEWTASTGHPRKLALFSVPSVSWVKEENPEEWSMWHSYVAIIQSPPRPQRGKALWIYDSDMDQFSARDKASKFLINPQARVVLASGKVPGSKIRFATLWCSEHNPATRGKMKCLYYATKFILEVVDDFQRVLTEGNCKRCWKLY